MSPAHTRPGAAVWMLALMAACLVLIHAATNGQYGFHRDELATVDDARHLDWGYVAYPPVTPFVARVALDLFGASLGGVRFFAALAQGCVLILAGLIARELGGGRGAQAMAAVAAAIGPVALAAGTLFQYVTFDYLWWVLAAWAVVRLLRSENPRWWLAIGAAIGLGMLTKYTMGFLVVGLAAGILLTPARRYLRSGWLYCGAALAIAMFVPNLIWQAHHGFISLEFLRTIHARDVRVGRTDYFLPLQLLMSNPFTLPLWLAGVYFVFRSAEGRRFRTLGWMFAVPMGMFLAAKGRAYYAAPLYPMMFAAGAVLLERRVRSRVARAAVWSALAVGAVLGLALTLPVAPVNSAWWEKLNRGNDNFREEIGWPELVQTVAGIRDTLPAAERVSVRILAGNYGEAGAVDLYGPAYGLPQAISGINSYWFRGYGDPPPATLIVLGLPRDFLDRNFESCAVAGHIANRYGVKNEETTDHPDIYLCRGLRQPWSEFWSQFRYFG